MTATSKARLLAGLLLAAVGCAWPTSASLARSRPSGCHRYSSLGDNDARAIARRAELGAELFALEHHGHYSRLSPAALHALERSIPISAHQARRAGKRAFLRSAVGTNSSYVVVASSLNGDRYTIRRLGSGMIARRALVCGKHRNW